MMDARTMSTEIYILKIALLTDSRNRVSHDADLRAVMTIVRQLLLAGVKFNSTYNYNITPLASAVDERNTAYLLTITSILDAMLKW
jgi:hypothetical protein